MKKKRKALQKEFQSAQAASELAIFGAILIFVIGGIIRTGFSANLEMHAHLKAFRYALTESYRTSQQVYSGQYDSAARNAASIILIEDRLGADTGEVQGMRDRVPMVASASASFSKNLLLPTDEDETWSSPVIDILINGQRFPLTASSRDIHVLDNSLPLCPTKGTRIGPRCWDPYCVKDVTGMAVEGCPVVYKIIENTVGNTDWCSGIDVGGSDVPCTSNIPADERFDLNRDGVLEPGVDILKDDLMNPGPDFVRNVFSWQWIKVPVVPEDREEDIVLDANIDWAIVIPAQIQALNNPRNYKTLRGPEEDCEDDCFEGDLADIDGDVETEELVDQITFVAGPPLVATIEVINTSGGEFDVTGRDPELGIQTQEFITYTFTRSTSGTPPMGTYYLIEEGKLFDPITRQFIRTTTNQDSVDVIQRRIILRKNDWRFCDPITLSPRPWGQAGGDGGWAALNGVYNMINPVEVCVPAPPAGSDSHPCFTLDSGVIEGNIYKNCMQVGNEAEGIRPEIFVRSRIKDLRGRRWITRMD